MPATHSMPGAAPAASRRDALANLMFAMRGALVERRQVIEIGETKFRFLRRNEEFEEGDIGYKALSSGVFAYYSRSSGGKQLPGIWMHLGSTDDLEDLLAPHLKNMAARQLEDLRSLISANAALNSMAADRRPSRQPAPSSRTESANHAAAAPRRPRP